MIQFPGGTSEGIIHRTTRVKRPQSNGIVERRRKWFETIDEMQTVLDQYLIAYNHQRPHQGRNMNGSPPIQAFLEGIPATKEVTRPETDDIMAA